MGRVFEIWILRFKIFKTLSTPTPPSQVCLTEPDTTGDRLDAFNNFLYQVTNTTVFKKAYQYLYSKGKGGDSWDSFYPKLFDMWFVCYNKGGILYITHPQSQPVSGSVPTPAVSLR